MSHATPRPAMTKRVLSIVTLAFAALVLAGAGTASAASKQVVSSLPLDGVAGETGDRFGLVDDIVANQPGGAPGDGDFYVLDRARVQQFDASGDFIRAWGYDVVKPGGAGNVPSNELQRVALGANTAGGTFTLSWNAGSGAQTTGAIAFDAPASGSGSVQAALEGLASIVPGDVLVTGSAGGPWTVEFSGAYADKDVDGILAQAAGLTVAAGPQVADAVTLRNGASVLEKCTVASDCKYGKGGNAPGQIHNANSIALDQSDGSVYVANGQTAVNNDRIDKFTADGDFIRGLGWDVVPPAQPGDLGEEQEIAIDATGGSFTLTLKRKRFDNFKLLESTAPIPFDATATTVQAAIEALPLWVPGDVSVSGPAGGPWVVSFSGTLHHTAVLSAVKGLNPVEMTADAAGLTGGTGTVAVSTTVPGQTTTGFELCTAASGCAQADLEDSNGGQVHAGEMAVDPRNGDLLVLDSRARVQRFNADGSFDKAIGWDVVPGEPQTLESCTSVALGACKSGLTRTYQDPFIRDKALGKLQGNGLSSDIAVDSAGNFYVAEEDLLNGPRVQRFTPEGTSAVEFAPEILNGVFSENPPLAKAIDKLPLKLELTPWDDHLYVSRERMAPDAQGESTARSTEVVEVDASGALVDVHAEIAGLGVASVTAKRPNDIAFGNRLLMALVDGPLRRVLAVDTPVAPIATVTAATDVTQTSATIHGSVDLTGMTGQYRFEYRRKGVSAWKPLPSAPLTLPGATPVSDALSGLQPGTTYEFRTVATKDYGGGTAASSPASFVTDPAPPRVAATAAFQAGPDAVKLTGLVDPQGLPTTYRFEYGAVDCSVGPCASVPAPDGSAGSAVSWVRVSQTVKGLVAGTTYHFRLVAANAEGTVEGPDMIFELGAAPPSGSGRAYEQVSPSDKNGVDVGGSFATTNPEFFGTAAITADGEGAAYTATGPFADVPVGCAVHCDYSSRRTPSGWTTEAVTPRPIVTLPTTYFSAVKYFASDLSAAMLISRLPLNEEGSSTGNDFPYRVDIDAGQVERIPGFPLPGSVSAEELNNGTGSDDLGVIAFTSSEDLTPDATAAGSMVFVFEEGGMRLVSRLPNGSLPFSAELGGFQKFDANIQNAVSADGRYVFFSAPASSSGQIYRRDLETETTLLVSPSKRAAPSTAFIKTYDYATRDGDMVFFRSGQKLTDDSTAAGANGADLYRYEVSTDTLTDLSVDSDGDDPSGAEVQAVVAISKAGDHVYYVAEGEVVDGAQPGQKNLFLWRDDGTPDGETRFVATLGEEDAANWSKKPRLTHGRRTAYAAASGDLLFQSVRDLTGHDDEVRHVYLYDPAADDDGTLHCVSCRTDGDFAGAPANVPRSLDHEVKDVSSPDPAPIVGEEVPRVVSSDGKRAFFETAEPLVPQDINGKVDVYEWRDGELALISTGTDSVDSRFMGAGANGRDVFFITRQKLVPTDGDTLYDVYDARIGGGFPISKLPPCVGEECRPEPQDTPVANVPSSAFFAGGGNVSEPSVGRRPGRRCAKGKQRVVRRGKARCVKRKNGSKRATRRTGRRQGGAK